MCICMDKGEKAMVCVYYVFVLRRGGGIVDGGWMGMGDGGIAVQCVVRGCNDVE